MPFSSDIAHESHHQHTETRYADVSSRTIRTRTVRTEDVSSQRTVRPN